MSLIRKDKKEKVKKAIESGDTGIVPGIVKKILPIVETKPKISDVQKKAPMKKQQKTGEDEPAPTVQQPAAEQPPAVQQEKMSTGKKIAIGAAAYAGIKTLSFFKKHFTLSIPKIMDKWFPPSK